jgi:hypothetical protein
LLSDFVEEKREKRKKKKKNMTFLLIWDTGSFLVISPSIDVYLL